MEATMFRAIAGPQFADQIAYTPETVQFWLDQAAGQLDAQRWGRNYDLGIMLLTAHNLTVNAMTGAGPVSSKSVGGVSVAYNTGQGMIEGAGEWNLSSYGQRFYRLAKPFGIGGIQL